MSDNIKKEPQFMIGIDTLRKLINDPSTDEDALKRFAESEESEESAFNVMRIDKNSLTPESKSRLLMFAKLRMSFLKEKFDPKGGGRRMPGKMEYDTIKEAIDDFNISI